MSGILNSNYIENDELNLKNEERDYKDLITKLKEIKSTIALLEKTIFNKFYIFDKNKSQQKTFFIKQTTFCLTYFFFCFFFIDTISVNFFTTFKL